jgi:polysaccharide deacetylase family protein (PEP-CTERM system associated)
MVINALTVDVEDYFQIHAFSDVIRVEDWNSCEPTVEKNTYKILDLLDSINGPRTMDDGHAAKPRATFFVLGWVAERYPNLVKEINARGHEVACHGYGHQCICNQGKEEFREDVTKAKRILEDLIGTQVIGYRAPTCSITRETIWALEIIFELGFLYDSSIFPIKHDFYGFPEAPRFAFYIDFSDGNLLSQFQNPKYLELPRKPKQLEDKGLETVNSDAMRYAPGAMRDLELARDRFVEFPLSTISVLGQKLPCSGGGYFRLFPYWYTRRSFKKLNSNGTKPVIFYIHPWELDPDIPVIERASWLSKFRTYRNLHETEFRFMRLLEEFRFAPLASLLGIGQRA